MCSSGCSSQTMRRRRAGRGPWSSGAVEREEPVLISLPVIIETEWVLRSRYTFDKAAILASLSGLMAAREFTFEDEPAIEEALYRWKDSAAGFVDCLIAAHNRRLGCSATATFDAATRASSGVRRRVACAPQDGRQHRHAVGGPARIRALFRFPKSRRHDRPHPIRPQPHRHPAHRRRTDGALLLVVRTAARRHLHPAHRRHRPERSSPEAVQAILDGMKWLGLD